MSSSETTLKTHSVFKGPQEATVVVGALGTIGRVLVKKLSEEGAPLLLVDIDEVELVQLKESLSSTGSSAIHTLRLDEASREPGVELVDYLTKSESPFRHLVNTAYPGKELLLAPPTTGSSQPPKGQFVGAHVGFFLSMSMHFAEYAARLGGGSITNLSSIYGRLSPRFGIYEGSDMSLPIEYGAAKAGVETISQHLATQYRSTGVRVNCVAPGGISANQPPQFQKQYGERTMSSALLEPDDVVGAITLLRSSAGSAITGQTITVDDGFSLG